MMMAAGKGERLPARRGDITGPVYVTATTGFITWTLNRVIFGDSSGAAMPPEVFVWVQLTVPMGLGWIAAEWRVRTALRRRRNLPRR